MSMGDELKWLLKEGGGRTFESCDISLENTPTPHTVLFVCSDSAMPYAITTNKWYLPSFVSPSSCNVLLLLRCFLLNITACTTAQVGGCTFERKAPFATTSFNKGGGCIFEGGPIFERFR